MAQEAVFQDMTTKGRSLEYVFVISRHGQRSPVTKCSLLPKPSTEDYGQLTVYGREQTRALGRLLKDRYGSMLSDQPGEVLASHNKHQRTKDSVISIMEGLGVPLATPVQDKSHYDLLIDAVIAENYQNVMNTPSRGHFKTVREIVDYVCTHVGSPTNSQQVTLLALDSLLTCVNNGYPIPDWARPYWDELRWADRMIFTVSLAGAEKPLAAYILKHILETLSDKYERGIDRRDKMHLFSTSDVNVYAIMKLLNPMYSSRPGFCATLLIEIFHEGDYIKAELLFADDLDPQPLRPQKLSNPCLLAELLNEIRRQLHTE